MIGLRTRRRCRVILLTVAIGIAVVILWQVYARNGSECTRSPVRPQDFPACLKAPEGASHICYSSTTDSEGAKQLYFRTHESYPANTIIDFLSTHLTKCGFHKLDYDLLNPEIPSSRLEGWGKYDDSVRGPACRVHEWHEDWLNGQGDTVSVTLEYRYPIGEDPDLDDLGVVLLWSKTTDWKKPFLDSYLRTHEPNAT